MNKVRVNVSFLGLVNIRNDKNNNVCLLAWLY